MFFCKRGVEINTISNDGVNIGIFCSPLLQLVDIEDVPAQNSLLSTVRLSLNTGTAEPNQLQIPDSREMEGPGSNWQHTAQPQHSTFYPTTSPLCCALSLYLCAVHFKSINIMIVVSIKYL